MTTSDPTPGPAGIRPTLTPPDSRPEPSGTGGGRWRGLTMLAGALLIAVGLVAVLFLLPADQVEQSAGRAPAPEPLPAPAKQSGPVHDPAAASVPGTEAGATAAAPAAAAAPGEDERRAAATAARERFLELQIEAETEAAATWGKDRYAAVEAALSGAEQAYARQQWERAAAAYRRLGDELESLLQARPQIHAEALSRGRQALAGERAEEARRQFTLALAADPSSDAAAAGLARAESLPTVIDLYGRARDAAAQGDLDEAQTLLAELLSLDPAYQPAAALSAEIRAGLVRERFRQTMASFLTALDERDLAAAGRELRGLERLGIEPGQVEQARERFAAAEEQEFVESRRRTAATQRAAEQWEALGSTFDEILAVAPDALFATQGRDEAARRAELDRALRDAIERPERLQDDGQRAFAEELLGYAKSVPEQGPLLRSQIEALDSLITTARAPVPVVLESDNETEVTIYRVGRMGTFATKRIELKPGTYTVVGSRIGYRDVRREVTIAPGDRATRLEIRCEEPI